MTCRTAPPPLRVLIVEDESLIAFGLGDLLADLGHRVVAMAATPDRALRLLGDLAGGIDVAMVDANLGGRSSVPVIAALRGAGIPVAVTSGYDREALEAIGIGLGSGGVHMVKPYSRDELRRTLTALTGTA